MQDALFLLSLFVCSLVLTGLYRYFAVRAQIYDVPVFRSAHSTPVPVGGGIVILFLFCLSCLLFYYQEKIALSELMALTGAVVIGVVGWIDDISELKISIRISLQLLAATWSVFCLGDISDVSLLSWTLESGWLLKLLAILSVVWLLNLYNFMDGIDGIAGAELLFVAAMPLVLVAGESDLSVILYSQVLLAAGAGFLFWNWAPAKIFMGDVGSSFIGFTLGIIAIISLNHGLSVWTWLILLAVFISDATLTLIRRYLSGETWYQGHATHAYQKAAKRFNSHSKVTITMTGINCLWLAPWAWGSVQLPELGVVFALIAVVPLFGLAAYFEAGVAVGTKNK